MAFFRGWIVLSIFLNAGSAFAADAWTSYQQIFNSLSAPARWDADFQTGAFGNCEIASATSPQQTQSIVLGVCSFQDGANLFRAPCYLPSGPQVRYGFSLSDSASVYGDQVQTKDADLQVLNLRGLTIANYRRGDQILAFRLGTSQFTYGVCRP